MPISRSNPPETAARDRMARSGKETRYAVVTARMIQYRYAQRSRACGSGRVATLSPNPAKSLEEQFERLVNFEPTTLPVISLYLNMQPDDHGRDRFAGFIDRQFASRARTFAPGSPEAESFARDNARIPGYLDKELKAP